jgi:hypothetical protein
MMFEVGDLIENTVNGSRRVVRSITPAGAFGTRVSDGPTFHAVIADAHGNFDPRGHSAAIWSGSFSYPTREWVVVERAEARR